MKAGISEIILPHLSLEEFFAQAAKMGYDAVEVVIGANMPLQLHNADRLVPQIQELSREYDLPVASLVQWQCTGNLLESGEKQRISIEQTCQALEIGHKLGAKASLHTLGYLIPEVCYDEAFQNAVDSLRKIAPTAEKCGVALAVEFVWNGFLFSPLEMKTLLDAVGSDAVGFYFDPGNMAIYQYPQHWARILGKYIKAMHIKDWVSHITEGSWQTGKPGNVLNGEWTPLTKGAIDFASVMTELHTAGYDGPMINEVDTFLAPIDQTLSSMRNIIAL